MINEENEMTYCIKYEMCKHLPALDWHDCNMFTTSVLYFQRAVYRVIVHHQIVKKPQPATKIQYVNVHQIYENLTT